ncbi:MAG TPA: hypothetical protein VJ550_01985 [Geomonas sp.]|nr:hypothetical protein [Geomonas sp.]
MRRVLAAVSLLLIAGCGNIQWFPSNTSNGSTPSDGTASPTPFTFTDATMTLALAQQNQPSESNMVTIQGTNAAGWTLTLTDTPSSANGEAIINGQYYLKGSTMPAVKPTDTLQIVQVASKTVGGVVSTKVKLGNYSTHFRTTTTN